MGAPNDMVTWFEVASSDVAGAREPYEGVFGWQLQGDPDAYLAVPPTDHGGIAGGATFLVRPTGSPGGVPSAYLRDPDGSLISVDRLGSHTDPAS